MTTEREADEAAARCVAILVYHHHVGQSKTARAATTHDLAEVGRHIHRQKLSAEAILLEVRKELGFRFEANEVAKLMTIVEANFKSAQPSAEPAPKPPLNLISA